MSTELNKPNYLRELLLHDYNIYGAAFAVASSVAMSIPLDSLGWLPMFLFAAVQVLMITGGVADSGKWVKYIDTKYRNESREVSRSRLLDDLKPYLSRNIIKPYMAQYFQMQTRVEAMYGIARDARSQIGIQDVDQFNDMTINYLSLLLAWVGFDNSMTAQRVADAKANVEKIQVQLRGNVGTLDKTHLIKALNDYQGIIDRAQRRAARVTTIESSLSTIPDKLEEVYQMLVTSPYSNETSQRIEESLNTLLRQEEVDSLIESELSAMTNGVVSPLRKAPVKQAISN